MAPVPTEVSRAIGVARLVLIVGLVALHYLGFPGIRTSPFWGMDTATPHWVASYAVSFMLFFFFSAVPLLSMISGWLFFRDAERGGAVLARRIIGRFRTLAVPFVLWNALVLAAFFLVYRLAPGQPLLSLVDIDFDRLTPGGAVDAVLGMSRRPVAFQFWFVRDLIVTVLLCPLLRLGLRWAPVGLVAALFGLWLSGFTFWGLFLRLDVPFFFVLGGFVRIRRLPVGVPAGAAAIAMALYLGLVAVRTLAPLAFDAGDATDKALVEAATRLMRLVGVVACWGAILRLSATRAGDVLARQSGLAFFLFAFHFPAIVIVKHGLWRVLPNHTDAWMLAQYAASVSLTVAAGIVLARVLGRLAPGPYGVLSGGRGQ